MMTPVSTYIPYSTTNKFSKLVLDYISGSIKINSFYNYPVNKEGIAKSIEARNDYAHRDILVNELKKQYEGIALNEKVQSNINALLHANTFTITTAHQPNIFTGPLYFIYKILHSIKLAEELSLEFTENRFVPVYYMGSEDADFEELSYINIDGKKYQWETKQTGAVGRMKVDKALLSLIDEMKGQLAVLPFGNELVNLFSRCYTENKTIQQATLEIVNELFGKYGLVILIPDNATLKKIFASIIAKELKELFSHKAVEETAKDLQLHYKLQAPGRDLNLFYLIEDKRERIELQNSVYIVRKIGIEFSLDEILKELETHPERFSPNVILRGAFQEMILPNIAFIGGGGEIAYWLELKKVFDDAIIPFPVLILRNSFSIIEKKVADGIIALGLNQEDLFLSEFELMNKIVLSKTKLQINISSEIEKIKQVYLTISQLSESIDKTLIRHTAALQTKSLNRLYELEKKMLRSEKRKFELEKNKLQKLRQTIFPNEGLQERFDNMATFYSKYGPGFIDSVLKYSTGMQQNFCILSI